ncbi:ubl carboxyl-terminal hydrolase 18 isoform X2 [Solea solea]|uniref:ubl carboxyl-terminal hydrolase 18 isoform X2 n=1 Tax=Solea solea TaxID=90069 RepID=UPI00272C9CF8|nr:ubl carboxyl-terminal hydrolase 18 isoform X2 [Solea solea]
MSVFRIRDFLHFDGLFHGSHAGLTMRGLTNYRLSCCVNTLVQTLSATWELSDLLQQWNTAGVRSGSLNVPLQLKRLLLAMMNDVPQHVPHRDFLHCLDRNAVSLNVQHDADEVFLSILNSMYQQMDDRELALEIQDLYKVSVETRLQCLECTSVQTRSSYLLSLPLRVKEDHNRLEDCISSFLEVHELRDINSCFCARCETKTPSKQGVKLLSLPRIVCMHLKRFRYRHGNARKLNCQVTFPETLDFCEIAKDGFSADFAQSECTYTLYAVVVHCGGATFGHYTAFVRDRVNQEWYHADDSRVKRSSWANVQRTYGNTAYSGTAYMLMYRRDERQQPQLSG